MFAASIKEKALSLGFDACGIAAAGNVDPEDCLGAWIARGYHADMDWLVRTKALRQDPRLRLPNARSVVVVAKNYYARRPEPVRGTGQVSRYAWGRDYHRVLEKPIKALAEYIGAPFFLSVDSGPVLERAWAARAGLGWIGKNGLVLRKDLGSWFFLGVIVTEAELEPDEPVANACGECRRCVEACPTGAIVEPGVVAARRCISYLTIENRNPDPPSNAEKIGNWVFGCDVCQEVCPWNRSAKETTQGDFRPRPGCANPDLAELLSLSEEAFNERFAGTPIRRAKWSGMRRNAAVAATNAER